jgi:hypothetical protein
MHAANKVTELHVTWVDMLTAKTYTYVELPTFCTSEWLRGVNLVIYFHFLVSLEEIKETETLNVALNSVSLKPKYIQSRLPLLDDVCESGVQVLVAYFVWI